MNCDSNCRQNFYGIIMMETDLMELPITVGGSNSESFV